MALDRDTFALRMGAITDAPTVVELRVLTMAALGMLDITAAFFLAPLSGDPRLGRVITNIGLPTAWERRYRSGLHVVDPLPRIALQRTGAFTWPEGIAGERMADRERRYLRIAARNGLARGIGTACYGPHGRSGFLGGARPGPPPPDERILLRFNAVGQLSFQRYCSLIPLEEEMRTLSDRELEVLQWIARGKSNSVIAEILEISPSSVDAYVRRIFAKLGAADRTTASLKAFSLGLILSADYEQLVRETIAREARKQ